MDFSKDIQMAMKDCILKLFWSKDEIIDFFHSHGCTAMDIKVVKNSKASLTRYKIIDVVFSTLQQRNDKGIGQFTSILDSLSSWSYFNPYYFDELKKLNKKEAERAISQLKQLKSKREFRISEFRTKRDETIKEKGAPQTTLNELKNEFLNLYKSRLPDGSSINPNQRGFYFENFINRIVRLSGIEITESFKISGEQIDGSLKYDGEHYLLEMKWQDNYCSTEPLYAFAQKIEGKMYGRGIFISVNGFSTDSVVALTSGKVTKTILIDGQDIIYVLEGLYTFKQLLEEKVKAAQTRGQIYIDITNKKNKIGI